LKNTTWLIVSEKQCRKKLLAKNEQGRVFLESVSLSPVDKEKISHANAERLLQLSKAARKE
jgi:hypothetical protein